MAEMRVFPAPKSVFQGFDGTFVDPDESDSYEDPKTEDSPTVHCKITYQAFMDTPEPPKK